MPVTAPPLHVLDFTLHTGPQKYLIALRTAQNEDHAKAIAEGTWPAIPVNLLLTKAQLQALAQGLADLLAAPQLPPARRHWRRSTSAANRPIPGR